MSTGSNNDDLLIEFNQIIREQYEFVSLYDASRKTDAIYTATLWETHGGMYFITLENMHQSRSGDVHVEQHLRNLSLDEALSKLSAMVQANTCKIVNKTKVSF